MNDDGYYSDYKLQQNCTNNALELSLSAMAPLIPQMIGSSNSSSNITKTNDTSNNTALNGALNNATMAQGYQEKMLKNAKTGTEKKYAQTLIEQSKALIDYLNIIKEFGSNTNGTGNSTAGLMDQMDKLSNETQNYQEELDAIKNNDTNFKNRLNDADKKSNS